MTSRHMINDHLMALAYDNQAAVFDVNKKCQLWRAAANTDRIQVSPDGSVLAFSAAGQVAFVQTKTGQPIGGLPRPIMFGGSMAFSPDGTMFAVAHLENLWVYRIAGGELLRTITASGALTLNTQPLIWPTTRYLVTPNGHLIDLSAGFVVWKYNGDLQVTEFSDHLSTGLVAMADDEVVSFQRLPHREALDKSQGDLSGQIVLQPPNPIQLKLEVDASLRPNRSKLIDNLTRVITQAGYVVDSSADTILTVNVRRSRAETLNYIVLGPDSPGGNAVTVTYNGIGTNAELNLGGERIWKSSTGTGMGTPSFKPRREPYEVTRELNDRFLLNFSLPKRVISPKFQNGFGSTWVRVDGLQ